MLIPGNSFEHVFIPNLKSRTVLLYVFSTMNDFFTFTFVVEVMFNLRTFLQVLAIVIKIFSYGILYFEFIYQILKKIKHT